METVDIPKELLSRLSLLARSAPREEYIDLDYRHHFNQLIEPLSSPASSQAWRYRMEVSVRRKCSGMSHLIHCA